MKKSVKRKGLQVTINQLRRIADDLEKQTREDFIKLDANFPSYAMINQRLFQINIINREPECSDTWEIEE